MTWPTLTGLGPYLRRTAQVIMQDGTHRRVVLSPAGGGEFTETELSQPVKLMFGEWTADEVEKFQINVNNTKVVVSREGLVRPIETGDEISGVRPQFGDTVTVDVQSVHTDEAEAMYILEGSEQQNG